MCASRVGLCCCGGRVCVFRERGGGWVIESQFSIDTRERERGREEEARASPRRRPRARATHASPIERSGPADVLPAWRREGARLVEGATGECVLNQAMAPRVKAHCRPVLSRVRLHEAVARAKTRPGRQSTGTASPGGGPGGHAIAWFFALARAGERVDSATHHRPTSSVGDATKLSSSSCVGEWC